MTTSTLAIVNAPSLSDGLVELLRIGEALTDAEADGCGIGIRRDPEDGRLLDVAPDPELPPGVLETYFALFVDPWATDGHPTGLPIDWADAAARLELLELLAHVTHGDILATAQGVELL